MTDECEHAARRVYDGNLASSLRRIFLKHRLLWTGVGGQFRPDDVDQGRATTIRAFDDALTIHSFGWPSVDAYYAGSGSCLSVPHLTIPTLCVQVSGLSCQSWTHSHHQCGAIRIGAPEGCMCHNMCMQLSGMGMGVRGPASTQGHAHRGCAAVPCVVHRALLGGGLRAPALEPVALQESPLLPTPASLWIAPHARASLAP